MKKNIAIFIPTLKNGGMEKVAANMSIYLNNDYNLYLILYSDNNIIYDFKGNIISLDIPNTSKNILVNFLKFIKRIFKLRKIKKLYKIDATISFSEGPNIINLLSKMNDKIIFTVHSIKSKRLSGVYGLVTKLLIKRLYNKADNIITVSKLIKKDLIDNFNIKENNIRVIYNPINDREIDILIKENIDDKYKYIFNKKVLINIGRLTEVKAHKHLLKSFSIVCEKRNDINLLLVGDGELKEKLEAFSIELGIQDRVFFTGFQSNPYKFLKRADMFVLTSIVEGFPNVVIESMYCGIPILSTDCEFALREVFEKNNYKNEKITSKKYCDYGILVPNMVRTKEWSSIKFLDEEIILANTILELIDNNNILKKYSIKAGEKVKEYLVNNIIKSWYEILQD